MKIIIKKADNIIAIQLVATLLCNPFAYAEEPSGMSEASGAERAQTGSAPESAYENNLRRWQGLSETERQGIRERARRLGPKQRRMLRERANRFRNMPQGDRDRIRGNYQRFREMPPDQRQMMRERHGRFNELPRDRKEALRRRFRPERGMGPGGPGQGRGPGYRRDRDLRRGAEGRGFGVRRGHMR